MNISVPYGKGQIEALIPEQNFAGIILPKTSPKSRDVFEAIRMALKQPISSPPLRNIVTRKRQKTAVIVINDITRPIPTRSMIQLLLEELAAGGIRESDVTVIVATGNHRPATADELAEMLGVDLVQRLHVINHIATEKENLVFLGTTSQSVPVWINKVVAEADVKILTGRIGPHHAAGFSGGRKSILPGVSGIETLNIHHSFPIRAYQPALGWYENNPFHEQALEAARMAQVDFIVNSVHNIEGGIVEVVAGDLEKAHEKGMVLCRELCTVEISCLTDIAIVSPGGYPRDINLHQSQKAVSCGELVVKPEGTIILVAECASGIGNFKQWLLDAENPEQVIERFKQEGYTKESSAKAFMFARALVNHNVMVVNKTLEEKELQQMFLQRMESLQNAVEWAISHHGADSKVLVVPRAVDILPVTTSV